MMFLYHANSRILNREVGHNLWHDKKAHSYILRPRLILSILWNKLFSTNDFYDKNVVVPKWLAIKFFYNLHLNLVEYNIIQ